MKNHPPLRALPFLAATLLTLFSQGVQAQSKPAAPAGSQPTSTLTLKRDVPHVNKIMRPGLPPDQVTITIPNTRETNVRSVIDPKKVSFRLETFRVSSLPDLQRRLKENSLTPTTEVLSLIYDLNPAIARLDQLLPDTRLVLPKVEGGDALRQAVAADQLTTLASDSASAQLLILRREQADVRTLSEQLMRAEVKLFSSDREKAEIKQALDAADSSLDIVGGGRFATSTRVREQTALESKVLKSISKEVMSGRGITQEQLGTMRAISRGMAARVADLRNGGSGSASVEVHTLRRTDGAEVKQKRVFCAPKLDPSAVRKYRDPSSPTSEALPLGGEYIFWAGEGDDATPISDKVPITILSRNDPIKLQIATTGGAR